MSNREENFLEREHQAVRWLSGALGLPDSGSPFAWQLDLLDRFLRGVPVEALDIPTGLGKTAVMAIWLVARAVGADVPRRLVYVVDRRAVVDQATEVAERLRAWLGTEASVANALQLGGKRLPISTLRGQHVDNRAWSEDPSVPAIVVGTVDMVGSRILFSGYGVSRKMRPYHAGLLGTDALVVLDEAHLSSAFERLLEQLASGVDANGRELAPRRELSSPVPRFRFLSLSATGRDRQEGALLRLTSNDRRPGGVVAKRLEAPKRLSARGDVPEKDLPEALASEAWELVEEGTRARRVIIFATSRDHAQKVADGLAKRIRVARLDGLEPVLFVGGRRVYERQAAASKLRELGFLAGHGASAARPAFVVATAAGEVGVDLDADDAVCDLVAWERMVQRLGRVNRRGEGSARVILVPCAVKDEAEQARREAVRALLGELPARDGAIDVSLAALGALKERAKQEPSLRGLFESAITPAPIHPPLTRALVESWSMTSIEEHPGRPEVAPWIRGWPDVDEEPQTTLVWRRCLPVTDRGELLPPHELEAFRDCADDHMAERLETETWRVVEWLSERVASRREGAGLDVSTPPIGVLLDGYGGRTRVVRTGALGTKTGREQMKRELAGATLLVDARIGGLRDGLLAPDEDTMAPDVTELEGSDGSRIVPFRVRRVTESDVPASPEGWRTEARLPVAWSEETDAEAAWLVVESVVAEPAESEEGRSTAKRSQLLVEHEAWTEAEARAIAGRLGVPGDLTEVLALAACLHDEGKRAPQWQRAFKVPGGGEPPYAKSATSRPDLALLGGYRHELGSLPYAEADQRVKALSPELRELCLHLIAAHHGSARPVIRTMGAVEPPTRLEARAREIALRFASLERRWGPWGLAWWEALLRAADVRASRRNDEEARVDG